MGLIDGWWFISCLTVLMLVVDLLLLVAGCCVCFSCCCFSWLRLLLVGFVRLWLAVVGVYRYC